MSGINLSHDKDKVSIDHPIPDLGDVKVLGWNLVIQPIQVRETTESGLELADRTIADMQYLHTVGRVVAMGVECYKNPTICTETDESGKLVPWVSVGDFIVYGKNTGQRVYLKGHNLVLLAENLPLLKISNPNDVDPFYDVL